VDNPEIKASVPIYDMIGAGYNHTRTADPLISSRLSELLSPETGETYLDIGCGTGNYTIALAGEGYNFYGIDPSAKMLAEARSKSDQIEWINGSSERVSLPDRFFAGAIATLTVHHWKDLTASFAELSRVLKDNSRLVVFTSSPQQMSGYWLNHYFPKMLSNSIGRMPAVDILAARARMAGLTLVETEKYFVQNNLEDLFLYCGKHDPERYFDPEVRAGMSSFAALSDKEEVSAGLKQLREDLDKERFESVKEQYANEWGDYLFLLFVRDN